jgi:hypothetical protein
LAQQPPSPSSPPGEATVELTLPPLPDQRARRSASGEPEPDSPRQGSSDGASDHTALGEPDENPEGTIWSRQVPGYSVPPEPEPDEIPVPPAPRPGITPTEPDESPKPSRRPDIIIPEEPDQIPPIPPGPEPTPEVPPPARIPAEPDPDPTTPGEKDPLDVILGPVQGPEPRPVDPPARPERTTLRRDRSDTTSIADLLTEALVAYQATAPDELSPEPAQESTPPVHRAQSSRVGRHRLPDWASFDVDG